jgi:RNA polymerase sigma-70 factor, ECF subfamily
MCSDRLRSPAHAEVLSGFEPHRAHLLAVAYRFLGSVSDAEDIVQETYLRWVAADRATVRDSRAFLSRITARLCLDHLKSARVRRESYVGPWLPEPLVETVGGTTAPHADATGFADDVSIALMLALERLSPLERAAFILHDTFGQSFDEVAAALDRPAATCRQLAARARSHLRADQARFKPSAADGERFVQAFQSAARSGDLAGLTRLLASDAVMHSDSGGKVRAARRLILGADRIARFFGTLIPKKGPPIAQRFILINGMPGILLRDSRGVLETLAFEIHDGAITALYQTRNPDKLRHLEPLLAEPGNEPAPVPPAC